MCEHCEYAQHIVVGTGVLDCPYETDLTLFLNGGSKPPPYDEDMYRVICSNFMAIVQTKRIQTITVELMATLKQSKF